MIVTKNDAADLAQVGMLHRKTCFRCGELLDIPFVLLVGQDERGTEGQIALHATCAKETAALLLTDGAVILGELGTVS